MGKLIRSSKAAAIIGIHKATFHKWEKDGHLTFTVHRSPTNHRLYDEDDVRRYLTTLRQEKNS